MADDDYLRNSADALERAWRDINMGLAETIHGVPQRYEHGGLPEVVIGSPAWEAYRAASETGMVPGVKRRAFSAGGYYGVYQPTLEDILYALRIAHQYTEAP